MTVDEIECIEEGGTAPTIAFLRRLAAALDADVRVCRIGELSIDARGAQVSNLPPAPGGLVHPGHAPREYASPNMTLQARSCQRSSNRRRGSRPRAAPAPHGPPAIPRGFRSGARASSTPIRDAA